MTPPPQEKSPLARLVLFMVCLSIAGSVFAGTHYLLVDRPAQEYAAHPPANDASCIVRMDLVSYTIVRIFGGYPNTKFECHASDVWTCCVV
jgi:hypothetical protein